MNSGRRRVRAGFSICPDQTPPLGLYGGEEEKEETKKDVRGSHRSGSDMDVETHADVGKSCELQL